MDRLARSLAYSNRRVRTGHTGPAVKVRRSNDNAEADFTPEEIRNGTMSAWIGSGNDGFIRTWYDQSGNALNGEQSTSGNQPKIITTQSKFGVASGLFDGSNDHLNAGSNALFAFGTGPFTIECFVNFNALPNNNQYYGIVGTLTSLSAATTDAWWLGLYNLSNVPNLYLARHGNAIITARSPWTPELNTWYHVAATRDSNNDIRLFVDGVSQSVTSTNNWGSANFSRNGPCMVGVIATPAYFNGYIDELRITKGVAHYTGTFTPPAD